MLANRRIFAGAASMLAVASVAVAPGIASDPPTSKKRAGAQASGALVSWQARWQTNFGKLRLNQRGRTVTGIYNNGNGHINARARGDTGRRLVGNWVQSGGNLRGSLVFVMSRNRCRFTGSYQTFGGGDGEWSGRRLVQRC